MTRVIVRVEAHLAGVCLLNWSLALLEREAATVPARHRKMDSVPVFLMLISLCTGPGGAFLVTTWISPLAPGVSHQPTEAGEVP